MICIVVAGCISAPQTEHISVLDDDWERQLKRLFVPLWLDKKVGGVGSGCSIVSLPSLAWTMGSCAVVDDVECDGVIFLQFSPESVVFDDGRVGGGAPVWAVAVAMIVVV